MLLRNFSLALFVTGASAQFLTYRADITALGGSGVTGTAVVFAGLDGSTVGYAGFAAGLGVSLKAEDCTATNGCGVHIHNGTSCADTAAQGGHYFVSPVTSDPWTQERYKSDSTGKGTYAGVVTIGTTDLKGRAFIIHAPNGTRIGCGLLQRVEESELLRAAGDGLAALDVSGVTGKVTAYQLSKSDDRVCFFGTGKGLKLNLVSYLKGGADCNVTNGCGSHIHAGTACTDATTQQGHYYNNATVPVDPWKTVGYLSTDSGGNGYFVNCVATGEIVFATKPFILHSNEGARVACGLLQDCETYNKCNVTVLGVTVLKGLKMHKELTRASGFLNNLGFQSNACKELCVVDTLVNAYKNVGYTCGKCPFGSILKK